MSAHTPGPWTYWETPSGSFGFDGEDGREVLRAAESWASGAPTLDDAALIKAAPDMLAALREMLRLCGEDTLEFGDAVLRAEATVAKAEGRA